MSEHDLDVVYKQNLEAGIIEQIAKLKNLTARKAMDLYYKSKLSEQIQSGMYGIENMDYKSAHSLMRDIAFQSPQDFVIKQVEAQHQAALNANPQGEQAQNENKQKNPEEAKGPVIY